MPAGGGQGIVVGVRVRVGPNWSGLVKKHGTRSSGAEARCRTSFSSAICSSVNLLAMAMPAEGA